MKERIRLLRKYYDLTQQEFADKIGIKRNTVATYEAGRNAPIDAVISLICREFNVSETWLRTGQGEMFLYESADEQYKKASAAIACGTSDLDRIIRQTLIYYYGMDDDSKKALLKYIESIATLLPAKKSLVDKTPSSAQLLGLDSSKDVG